MCFEAPHETVSRLLCHVLPQQSPRLEVLLPLLISPVALLLRLSSLMLLLLLHEVSLVSHLMIHISLLLHAHIWVPSTHPETLTRAK